MYSLTKDKIVKQQSMLTREQSSSSVTSVMVSSLVAITALVFVIGGSTVGGVISNLTDISYIEVRPSVDATLDIARGVYSESAFLGVGPNRFVDAWRLHKDPSINQTIFWETGFTAGSGYIMTWFVTTGLLGVVAWLAFLGSLLFIGYRMLIAHAGGDAFWYFIGSSSFVASLYLWGMSIIYVPGATIILLAGVFTSIVLVAYTVLVPQGSLTIVLSTTKRTGIVLVGVVMVLIVLAVYVLYALLGQHYTATYTFESAVNSVSDQTSLESVERSIAAAYQEFPNDNFARQLAQYQIAAMNLLIATLDPTAEQQAQFQQAASKGINAAQLAVSTDPSEPFNHATLGAIYSLLAAAGVEGATERAETAFAEASRLEPISPLYPLLFAQLYSRTGNIEQAREYVLRSINLKNNYTDALLLLTQIEIASGNVEAAINSASAIVSLQPNNPARLYQLGVLYAAEGQHEEAVAVFSRAVEFDPNYANARYFLALSQAALGNTDAAIQQLEIVRDLNPDNAVVQGLIDQIRQGDTIDIGERVDEPVGEPDTVSSDGAAVTTNEAPDTPLVTPVNVVPTDNQDTDQSDSTATEETGAE